MSNHSIATTRQGKPKRGVMDITELVRQDLNTRKAFGMKKYGMPLQSHNGRDPLVDAYQEAMDLTLYLKQAITERDMAWKQRKGQL